MSKLLHLQCDGTDSCLELLVVCADCAGGHMALTSCSPSSHMRSKASYVMVLSGVSAGFAGNTCVATCIQVNESQAGTKSWAIQAVWSGYSPKSNVQVHTYWAYTGRNAHKASTCSPTCKQTHKCMTETDIAHVAQQKVHNPAGASITTGVCKTVRFTAACKGKAKPHLCLHGPAKHAAGTHSAAWCHDTWLQMYTSCCFASAPECPCQ